MSSRGCGPSRVLAIAGFDPCGCSGLLADARTIDSLGAYSLGVVTALTAQNTRSVEQIVPASPDTVAAQLDAVLSDVGVDAIKVGMLANTDVAESVVAVLERYAPVPLVVDPVLESSTGARLFDSREPGHALRRLLSRTTVITPNLVELNELTGLPTGSYAQRVAAARAVVEELGVSAVLVKAGHGTEQPLVDVLYDGERVQRFEHPRIETRNDRGTGCTLSTALAVNLARALPLGKAVEQGIEVVQRSLRGSLDYGDGPGPIYQLAKQRRGDDGR